MGERLTVIEKPKKLLVITAHQDDETYAVGMLGKAAKAGHEVHLLSATNGDLGTRNNSSRDVIRERSEEFRASAALIGATSAQSLNMSEANVNPLRLQRELTAVTREVDPDIVITHFHQDYHHLHRLVGQSAEIATFNAPATTLRARRGRFEKLPWGNVPATPDKERAVYEMDPQGLKDRSSTHTGYDTDNIVTPGLIVELTPDELALKQEVYRIYHSQNGIRTGNRMPYVEQIALEAEIRGAQSNFDLGEGYTQVSYGGETFTTHNFLQEMFPGQVYLVK